MHVKILLFFLPLLLWKLFDLRLATSIPIFKEVRQVFMDAKVLPCLRV